MPFDVAFAADEVFVLAWIVADGENNGGEFLWDATPLMWKPQR